MILLLLLWIFCLVWVWYRYRRITYLGHVMIDPHSAVDLSHNHKDDETVRSLQVLRERAGRLVTYTRQRFPEDTRVHRLTRWNGRIDELEHAHLEKGIFGYNRNKGESISVCLHNKQNQMNPMNEMFYVVMHEMSHIMTDQYEHDTVFEDAFRLLLGVAIDHGLYEYVDYGESPVAFCDGYMKKNE